MDVNFKFEPGQKVQTQLGAIGVVEDMSVNFQSGRLCYVFTGEKDSTRWYPEDSLTVVEN